VQPLTLLLIVLWFSRIYQYPFQGLFRHISPKIFFCLNIYNFSLVVNKRKGFLRVIDVFLRHFLIILN